VACGCFRLTAAEVGATLRAVRTVRRQRAGKKVDVTERSGDPATVLAVFPGVPYIVVTDGRPIGGVVSAWVNPFMASSQPKVTYFSTT
jgi:hypothetical protein